MTRDLKPTRHDLWRLVEHCGSITHAAQALIALVASLKQEK